MKIYTRHGDSGSTDLFGGVRVTKSHPRLMAYGTLDELNSSLGVLRLYAHDTVVSPTSLQRVQDDLFVLGALLATPEEKKDLLENKMKKTTWSIADIEKDIDRLTDMAGPMTAFVLPGGSPGAAFAHVARTVCRRAERQVVLLSHGEIIDPHVVEYLNRLGDWLFAVARAENVAAGVTDIEWRPR
jgi:cob(I)alamin adenosyltransferase